MSSAVVRRFGTARGMVRLVLSHAEVALKQAGIVDADPSSIRRLVFVCHGNICRSAFADWLARDHGLNAVSFGLSTSSGLGAHPPVVEAAKALGVNLSGHSTARIEDYTPEPGDLLLAMEARQLRRIAAMPGFAVRPRTLLGLYAHPRTPHLHDPFGLDDVYLGTCLKRIESAVVNLRSAFPGARTCE